MPLEFADGTSTEGLTLSVWGTVVADGALTFGSNIVWQIPTDGWNGGGLTISGDGAVTNGGSFYAPSSSAHLLVGGADNVLIIETPDFENTGLLDVTDYS